MEASLKVFFNQEFSAEQALLNMIRQSIHSGIPLAAVPSSLSFHFDQRISQVFISLFQEKVEPIRWGSRKNSLSQTINRIIKKIRGHNRFHQFTVSDSDNCRILFEIVTGKQTCDPKLTTIFGLTDNRLEPGIDGLAFTYEGRTTYYMPTDAYVHNLMTMNQVYQHLAKRLGLGKEMKKPQDRGSLVRHLPVDFQKIRSLAFVTYKNSVLPLYRGIPLPPTPTRQVLHHCIEDGLKWLIKNQHKNGKFLYYYDAVQHSTQDFLHPKRDYYNILRHAGGTITLLKGYELNNNSEYLAAANKSLSFFRSTLQFHTVDGKKACFPFFNKKSKLGGAGVGLVALMQYYAITKDTSYNREIQGLVCHLLSRIAEDGEMIGYYIHPLYNRGEPLTHPSEQLKEELFSFYYPGEALLGLILYLKHYPDIPTKDREHILTQCELALDFLITKRPVKYKHLFQTLPSDGWLMQAIEEWFSLGGSPKQEYINFVFQDAEGMINHMYKHDNAPFFDYPGMFYYTYGEHAYPDGARCEGLIAAHGLALLLNDKKKSDFLLPYLKLAAKALLHTYNSEEASYPHKYPQQSKGSFRFKLTRQWVRVDSSQHALCFFCRLYPYLEE